MGRAVIKVTGDEDGYMVWSTIVETIELVGSRKEMLDEGITELELDRADEFGSSSYLNRGRWDSAPLPMANTETRGGGFFTLPREKFAEYARLMLADQEAEAEALLVPDDDEDL